ncbi:Uncharacterised protein [Capnocytophaga ochracea]|uniref:Uncharacterized protein n=1 Tax=Capnocytophaga ochracea TaxID=1018 RepID=A0A2X2UYF8_CAPOC|nr:Uncharacterised protein [Capnocytophaga ochracea]
MIKLWDNINRNVYEITYTGQFKKDYKKYRSNKNKILKIEDTMVY